MKTCSRCGLPFDNRTKYQKICDSCRLTAGSMGGIPISSVKVCPVCGKSFVVGKFNRKYCSAECYHESQKK